MRISHSKQLCWPVPAHPPTKGHITVTFLILPMPCYSTLWVMGSHLPVLQQYICRSQIIPQKATTYTLFNFSHDFSSYLLTMHFTQIYKQEEEEITRGCHGSALLGCTSDECSARAMSKGTWHSHSAHTGQGSPGNTKVQPPRAGWSYPCRWERNRTGRHGDLCQSYSHLSVSFLHCAHMGYTFNGSAAQTHLSLQSRRKKKI